MSKNVILIHGMWCNPETLNPLKKRLESSGYKVFVPMLPGHGTNSKNDVKNLSVSDYKNSVKNYIEELDLSEPPLVIGHSMGGLIAQLVACEIKLGPLVLLNSAGGRGSNHVFPMSLLFALFIFLVPFCWKQSNRPNYLMASLILFNCIEKAKRKEVYEKLIYESSRAFAEIALWPLDKYKASKVDHQKIKNPILLIHGKKDRIVQTGVAKFLKKNLPHAKEIIYSKNGHWLFHEPGFDRVLDDVLTWLEENSNCNQKAS